MQLPLVIHLQPYLNKSCGISRMIYQIVTSTSSEFHHIVITFGGDDIGSFIDADLEIIQLKRTFPPFEFLRLYALIKRLTRNQKSAIINSYHRLFDLFTFFMVLPKTINKVTNVHSVVYGKKFFSYFSDKFITPCKFVAQHLTNYFHISRDKISVIPNGINPNKYNILVKGKNISEHNKQILQGKPPFITFIGRIDKEKGIDILLKSATILWNREFQFSLNIFGNGPEEKTLVEFIYNNKFPVFWQGSIKDIEYLYQNSDIIVLPSRIDPFPLVMLEAGFYSKPFIGTFSGGMSEVITDGVNGRIVPPDDVDALSAAIEFFLNNPEKATQCGKKLHELIITKYSLEESIRLYKEYYYSLLKEI